VTLLVELRLSGSLTCWFARSGAVIWALRMGCWVASAGELAVRASGADGVGGGRGQLVVKDRGEVVEIEHIGSARTDAELALLLAAACERLQPGQQALEFGELVAEPVRLDDTADWTRREPGPDLRAGDPSSSPGRPRSARAGARVVGTSALMLWNVLIDAYARLGFDTVADEAFRAMVCARVIEPTSKADTVRVLKQIGAPAPAVQRDYRE
jgi:pentatricopeptide repeat protein